MRKFLFIISLLLILPLAIISQTTQFSLELFAKFDVDLGKNGQIGFSPDGKYFFALAYKKNLQVWETETQKRLYTINEKFESAKFSPNGKWLAVFSEKEGQILDFETGKVQLNLNNYKEKIKFLNWSPTSQKIAVGTENFVVDVWNIETGKWENTFKIHEKKKGFWAIDEANLYTITAEFSSGEKRLLTNCNDQEAEYWDLENGKLIFTFSNKYENVGTSMSGDKFAPSKIYKATISADGKWLVTQSNNETRLWDLETGKQINSFPGFDFSSFSPNSRYVGLLRDSISGVPNKLFDLFYQKTFLRLQQNNKSYGIISGWSPDSKSFVTAGENGSIWSLETGSLINTFKSRVKFDIFGSFSEDDYDYHPNSKILMVQNDKELRFFSTVRNEQLLSFPQAKRPAVWSPDGKFLLAQAKERGKIALWKVSE